MGEQERFRLNPRGDCPRLNRAAVLAIIGAIRGEESVALDADALVTLGLPPAFIDPLTKTVWAEELDVVYRPVKNTGFRAVWSFHLLRAFVAHYGLDTAESSFGHALNARELSDSLVDHLMTRRHDGDEKGNHAAGSKTEPLAENGANPFRDAILMADPPRVRPNS